MTEQERFLYWAEKMDLRSDREFSEDVICILFFYDNEKFAKRAFHR